MYSRRRDSRLNFGGDLGRETPLGSPRHHCLISTIASRCAGLRRLPSNLTVITLVPTAHLRVKVAPNCPTALTRLGIKSRPIIILLRKTRVRITRAKLLLYRHLLLGIPRFGWRINIPLGAPLWGLPVS